VNAQVITLVQGDRMETEHVVDATDEHDAEPAASAWPIDGLEDLPASIEIHLNLLNGFELRSGGRTIDLSLGSERLLAFLALSDRPLMRNFVAFSLWPDKDEERAHGNLRSALWRVRQAGLGLVETSGQRMAIGRDVYVDVRVVTLVANHVLAGSEIRNRAAVQDLLVLGDLLHDWYEPWVTPHQERLRQLRLHALETLSRQLLASGDLVGAIEAGLAAVASEPLRESAHRTLVEAHIAEGNPAEALRQYESYRFAASTELGVLPSAQMEQLVQPLRVVPTGARR
jgi:DNA-binding SARP family transcriptional activator